MTEETNGPAEAQQERPHADASIDLRMEGKALQINITGPEDQMANEAVHFAHWLGRNLHALSAMAKQDYELRRYIAANEEAERAKKVPGLVECATRRLVGPDGKPVQ